MTRDELRKILVDGCDLAMHMRIVWNRLTSEEQKVVRALDQVFAANDAVVDAILSEFNVS